MVLLAVAVAAAGCSSIEAEDRPGDIFGKAQVNVGGAVFPLSDVRIVVSGATNAVTYTRRDGSFALARLRQGQHTVQLQALHDTYERAVYVQAREQVSFSVTPAGISPALFYQLSGLQRVYVDGSGRITWDAGELVRWEKTQIHVYFDVASAPPGVDLRIVNEYWKEMERWEAYLGYKYRFVRANNPQQADIVVRWVPPNSMWPEVGVARHIARYINGSLKRVDIEIDAAWASYPGLWPHELAHAMGVGHVTDPYSVMYPILSSSQRTTLSPQEAAHVRLLYDVPSGQRLAGSWGARPADAELDAGEGRRRDQAEDDLLGAGGSWAEDELWLVPGHVTEEPLSGVRTGVLLVAPDVMP